MALDWDVSEIASRLHFWDRKVTHKDPSATDTKCATASASLTLNDATAGVAMARRPIKMTRFACCVGQWLITQKPFSQILPWHFRSLEVGLKMILNLELYPAVKCAVGFNFGGANLWRHELDRFGQIRLPDPVMEKGKNPTPFPVVAELDEDNHSMIRNCCLLKSCTSE